MVLLKIFLKLKKFLINEHFKFDKKMKGPDHNLLEYNSRNESDFMKVIKITINNLSGTNGLIILNSDENKNV